jgi:hypothetical protein
MKTMTRASLRGFTFLELLFVLATILLLVLLVLPMLTRTRGRADRIRCVNNLKAIGLGFRIAATPPATNFPGLLSTNAGGTLEYDSGPQLFRHFQALASKGLGAFNPKLLICPSDRRTAASSLATLQNSNISYFINLDATAALPTLLLAGDRNLSNNVPRRNGVMPVSGSQMAEWTAELHRFSGNAALSDGSVQSLDTPRLQGLLRTMGAITNRLLIP